MTIYKYPLELLRLQEIGMPSGALILTAQAQNSAICLWVMVNPNSPQKPRTVEIFATGEPLDSVIPHRKYVGTVQLVGYVWHVFESE